MKIMAFDENGYRLWDDELKRELLTPEEIDECDRWVELVGEIIRIREELKLSQKKLEEMSGVKQPVIARLERCQTNPRLETVLKILRPMGKTLKIVPIEEK